MTQLEAIKYLVENSVYNNEWRGAGMWIAVEEVMKNKEYISKKWLNKLLKEADEF